MTAPSARNALNAQLIVLAKAPVPGKVKTRLTPPFTPHEAAMLAEAALADTLKAGATASFSRHVLALADQWATPGALRAELPGRFEVVPQRGDGLDERIAAAFDDAYAQRSVPVVLIGMDTPQVTPGLLETVAQPLTAGDADAVFGPAADGGFWLLGLRQPDAKLIHGVPMSADHTGRVQLGRLSRGGPAHPPGPGAHRRGHGRGRGPGGPPGAGQPVRRHPGFAAPAAPPGDGQFRAASPARPGTGCCGRLTRARSAAISR